MPDRLVLPLEELNALIRQEQELRRADIVQRERDRRHQRWKNWVGAILLVAVALLVVDNRVDASRDRDDRREQAQQSCLSSNSSRLALRQAFVDDHETLRGVIAQFVNPDSENGQRFLTLLEAEQHSNEKRLAAKLPTRRC